MIDTTQLIQTAIKNQDNIKTKVYRAIKAEELLFCTKKGQDLTDVAQLDILKKLKARYIDSIEQYRNNNRPDLVEEESKELNVLLDLMPEAASKEFIEEFLKSQYSTPISQKNMGRIIKELKEKFPINDGQEIFAIVSKYIG